MKKERRASKEEERKIKVSNERPKSLMKSNLTDISVCKRQLKQNIYVKNIF